MKRIFGHKVPPLAKELLAILRCQEKCHFSERIVPDKLVTLQVSHYCSSQFSQLSKNHDFSYLLVACIVLSIKLYKRNLSFEYWVDFSTFYGSSMCYSSYATFGHVPQKPYILLQRYLLIPVHCCFIHISWEMEVAQMSIG